MRFASKHWNNRDDDKEDVPKRKVFLDKYIVISANSKMMRDEALLVSR